MENRLADARQKRKSDHRFFIFAVGKCLAEFTGKRSYYELRILPPTSIRIALSAC